MSIQISTRSERRCSHVVAGIAAMMIGALHADIDGRTEGAEDHRALIADFTTHPGHHPGGPNTLRLLDMDTGKSLGQTTIGRDPDLALSSDGSIVAVVSRFVIDGVPETADRVQLLRTSDLTPIAQGYLPFEGRLLDMRTAGFGVVAFADGDHILIIPRTFSPVDQPGLAGQRIHWTCIDVARSIDLQRAGRLKEDRFVLSTYPDLVGGNGVRRAFLSTRRWPLVPLAIRDFDPMSGEYGDAIQVLDFRRGAVVAETPVSPPNVVGLGEAPVLSRGRVLAAPDGEVAYFLPGSPIRPPAVVRPQDQRTPSPICRINLAGDQPQVVQQGPDLIADLDLRCVAVSEAAHGLAVTLEDPNGSGSPPRKFRVHDTTTLMPRGEIDTGMRIAQLAFSRDGSQIYAAQSGRGKGTIKVYRTSDLSLQQEFEDMYTELAVLVPLPGPKAGR